MGRNDGDKREDHPSTEGDIAAGEAAGLAAHRGALEHQAVRTVGRPARFEAGGVLYELPDGESFGFPPPRDERKTRLGEVLPAVKSKMRWDYDFGDGWEHDVVVEAIEPMDRDATYPVCIAGKRACPPDDCGGPWGYGNLLAAISDPTHEEHEELIEWLPPGFAADTFDVDEANEMMRSARPLRNW
ncbi:MAG: plasmid pRiA4b ORF-3 family protein [Ilumatobacteraceae bacterium]